MLDLWTLETATRLERALIERDHQRRVKAGWYDVVCPMPERKAGLVAWLRNMVARRSSQPEADSASLRRIPNSPQPTRREEQRPAPVCYVLPGDDIDDWAA